MQHRRSFGAKGVLLLCAALATGLMTRASEVRAGASGRDIMEKVTLTRKLDGSEAVLTMSIVNEKGQTRDRKLSMATKLYDGGKTEKRIYRFMEPADIKGTGVLVFDHESQADDMWIFLPALRKTRRIVSSERSKSFMGSEFSYGDLNFPSLDDYTYNVQKEENYGGEACYVIDVLPKSGAVASDEGYKKKTLWISKSKHAVRRGLYYDLDGKLLKELKSDDVKLLDPNKQRYRAMRMEMVNKQNNRRSLFKTEKVALSPDAKDEYFTTRYLERP